MNMVQKSIANGGKLIPLVIPEGHSSGLMNPSIFIDDDGDILVNLRHINYTLYHAENTQRFPTIWGPLAYLHPENDLTLRTTNYLCKLNNDLEITNYTKVDTSKLDVAPLWEFHGLEDCRIIQWNKDYYLVGVRRDTTPHGEGRMEYSKIDLDKKNWTAKEIERVRIPAPEPNNSYCEKNWMPVLGMPYTFVKWSMPTELVKADPVKKSCETVFIKQSPFITHDQRGGSQIINWGNMLIAFTHEVDLFKNYLGQKDAFYRHRMIIWDSQFNFVGITKPFTFLDARIEFCVGAAVFNGDLLLTFGFQDNAAFILRVPKDIVEDLIIEGLTYDTV